MPLTDPKDVLAYHASRPLTQNRDMRAVPVSNTAKAISSFMAADSASGTMPEIEALWFYAMNHGMAEIQKRFAPYEPLGTFLEFVETYHSMIGPKAVRAFYYLMLICTRESRHVHSSDHLDKDVEKLFGKAAIDFNHSIRGVGSSSAYKAFLNTPPMLSLGDYVGSLRHIFYTGKFSSGYGGPAWGQVADCLCSFVNGEFTAEMMMDTVWTLCHNNGPIFNKGMLYANYSGRLVRILDVQRSGQIPALILSDNATKPYVQPELSQLMVWLQEKFGTEVVGNFVDWFVVEQLGAKHSYPHEKAAQVKLYGHSPVAQQKIEQEKKKQQAKQMAIEAAKLEHKKKFFEVMPGLEIPKTARPKAA